MQGESGIRLRYRRAVTVSYIRHPHDDERARRAGVAADPNAESPLWRRCHGESAEMTNRDRGCGLN
jgi:hypothetical protein